MTKGFKRFLAAVMAVIMLFSGAQVAMAASVSMNNKQSTYIGYLEGVEIEGKYFVDVDDYSPIDIPYTMRGAKHFEVVSDDESIISVTDDLEIYGARCGATLLYIYQYDKNWDLLGTIYCIGIVRDDWDKTTKGYMTEAYDIYFEANYKDEFYISPEVSVRGDVSTYVILPSFAEGEATYTEGSDLIYASARGTDTYRAIVVDAKGNYQFVDVTIEVSFTVIQWIIWILLLGFLWY